MLFQNNLKRPIVLDLVGDQSIPYRELFHFHPGVEIFFIHEGVGQVILEQKIYDIKPGSLLFFRPFQPHYQQMEINENQPFIRSQILYNPEYFAEYIRPFPALYKFHEYLCRGESVLQIQHNLNPDKLNVLFNEFVTHYRPFPVTDDFERNALFLIGFFQYIQPLWEAYDQSRIQRSPTEPTVLQILKWIEDNYQQELQLEKLSQIVHLTPNHISSLFQKTTGKTITDFVTIRRMKQASLLLQTTRLSIEEVGQKSGYPNFSYFCQAFKKNIGITPAQFRLKMKENMDNPHPLKS